jgi:hypothetical protein
MSKRFQIVIYHLKKICEDRGDCAGLSANDASDVGRICLKLEKLFKSRTFQAYKDNPYIPEEEFDNESQANVVPLDEWEPSKAKDE